MFQFPSNGKLHSNTVSLIMQIMVVAFQFPSNGKLHSNGDNAGTLSRASLRRFNSLQTGNCIQTHSVEPVEAGNMNPLGFNSLQTGNCIQTRNYSASLILPTGRRFNSLQTGNCIQTEDMFIGFERIYQFQFPSNGKLHSNIGINPAAGALGRIYGFQFPSNGKLHSN